MDFPRRPPTVLGRVARQARRLTADWQVVGCAAAAAIVCAAVGAILAARPLAPDGSRDAQMPRYAANGELLRPERVEQWVFVGASIGLSYADASRTDGPGMFHNVYITPVAYEAFARTHTFPEGTMLAMTLHDAGEKVAPSKHGFFEGARLGLEVAVKDSARFPNRWAYFDFSSGRESARASGPSCHACHVKHAATDNVFTQFYPILRDLP
jgi:Cytochrome P460